MKKLMGLVLIMSVSVMARYHGVKNAAEFERLVSKYPYAVSCFAPTNAINDEKISKDQVRDLKDSFKDLISKLKDAANAFDFKKYLSKDVGFIAVDVAGNRAHEITRQYSLSQFPTCLLFKDGSAYSAQQLVQPQSPGSILSFIDRQVGVQLKKTIKEKKEDERLRMEERIAAWNAYGMWGYPYGGYGGYGYPYGWGWGYGYRYPRWGAGIAW